MLPTLLHPTLCVLSGVLHPESTAGTLHIMALHVVKLHMLTTTSRQTPAVVLCSLCVIYCNVQHEDLWKARGETSHQVGGLCDVLTVSYTPPIDKTEPPARWHAASAKLPYGR
jgi:hypothetical protein